MLYPTVEFAIQDGPYFTLQPGNLGYCRFSIADGEALNLMMRQMAIDPTGNLPQDQSIRCWVSDKIGGNPVVLQPINSESWVLSYFMGDEIAIYDKGMEAPEKGVPVPVAPGAYILNVLNLNNKSNMFGINIIVG
jgi:hypothetical protein